MGIKVFFSYSHRDEALRDELAKHLSILRRQGVIDAWHDRQITAGSEWAGEIDAYLNSAQIILLLISADFLASDYCYDIELKQAMERHEAGTACVIPIILKPVDWHGAPFGKLQALPKNAQAVTTWANQDEAFLNVAQGIRRAVEAMATQQTASNITKASNETAGIEPADNHLTPRQRQRLEQEQASLEQQYNLLQTKLEQLSTALRYENDPATHFKLTHQVEQAEAERDQIDQKLGLIETKLRVG